MSEKRLKGRIEQLENTLLEILHYCNHLHNDCKYNLNDGHVKKIRNICKRELGLTDAKRRNIQIEVVTNDEENI